VGKKSDHYISRTGTYTVEIRPLGHAPILRSEQSIRMMAKNVCEALSVLHAGLVHRDVRLPNVVQVSQEQFMLIDLERVAASPFRLPQGFQYFREWSIEMLEGNSYTPMSDMYQLGRLLEKDVHWMTEISESAL
jgi:serine/threonine protein kinase